MRRSHVRYNIEKTVALALALTMCLSLSDLALPARGAAPARSATSGPLSLLVPGEAETEFDAEESLPPLTEDAAREFGRIYGVYVGGAPTVIPAATIQEQLEAAYGESIDLSSPGWHLAGAGDEHFACAILTKDGNFAGLELTGLQEADEPSGTLYYNFWPIGSTAPYVIGWPVQAVKNYENTGHGVVTGSNHIPAAPDTAGTSYFYGVAFSAYERVYLLRETGSLPIVTAILVKMGDNPMDWAPDPAGGWTALTEANYQVAYSADPSTPMEDGAARYKACGLDSQFTPEEQQKLQAIVEHAYPFLSEEQMLKELSAAGVALHYPDHLTELSMIAAQCAVWAVTHPDFPLPEDAVGIGTRASSETLLEEDGRLVELFFSPEDCLEAGAQSLSLTGDPSNLRQDLATLIRYLETCQPATSVPALTARWDTAENPDHTCAVTVTGEISGYAAGDILTLDGAPVQVNEDGAFSQTLDRVESGAALRLEVSGQREALQAVYYRCEVDGPDLIGGQRASVPVADSQTFTVPVAQADAAATGDGIVLWLSGAALAFLGLCLLALRVERQR